MFVVRPVRTSDLPSIEHMAVASGIGVTSLPNNRDRLFGRIQQSMSSFDHEAIGGVECEYYMFVLEVNNKVMGTASICTSAGFDEPFYSYRSEIFVHASRTLGVNNRVHVLNMCHDLTGMVQLCGFYIDPSLERVTAELLSRARMLFIAGQRERFGRRMVAEMQGILNDEGHSPFWDAIGRRFFNMEFAQVEQAFGSHSKTFIAEMMPTYPIYVPLLPDDAQNAIGQIHPNFELPCQMLTREGFEADHYIDIFDGGAVLTAEIDQLYTLTSGHCRPVEVVPGAHALPETGLIGNLQAEQFAATLASYELLSDKVLLQAETATALGVMDGQMVRVVGLHHGMKGAV